MSLNKVCVTGVHSGQLPLHNLVSWDNEHLIMLRLCRGGIQTGQSVHDSHLPYDVLVGGLSWERWIIRERRQSVTTLRLRPQYLGGWWCHFLRLGRLAMGDTAGTGDSRGKNKFWKGDLCLPHPFYSECFR